MTTNVFFPPKNFIHAISIFQYNVYNIMSITYQLRWNSNALCIVCQYWFTADLRFISIPLRTMCIVEFLPRVYQLYL